MKRIRSASCVAVGLLLLASRASADVIEKADNGFRIRIETTVSTNASTAFRALTDVGSWWNAAHSYSGDAKNLSIQVAPGGCFCEKLRGGGVVHMTVVFVDAGKQLRLVGGLGPLQQAGVSGALTWTLTEANGATTLESTYSAGGFWPGGLGTMAEPVDAVLRDQMARYKRFVERGRP